MAPRHTSGRNALPGTVILLLAFTVVSASEPQFVPRSPACGERNPRVEPGHHFSCPLRGTEAAAYLTRQGMGISQGYAPRPAVQFAIRLKCSRDLTESSNAPGHRGE